MLIVDRNARFHDKEDDFFLKKQIFRKPPTSSLSKGTKEISSSVQCMLHRENLDELKATMELQNKDLEKNSGNETVKETESRSCSKDQQRSLSSKSELLHVHFF